MFDYPTIVDSLRVALYSAADGYGELFPPAVAEYAQACEEVNQRLSQIGGMLRRGERGEAIRQAEIRPPVRETVTLLDFAERDQAVAICRQLRLPPPPPLQLAVVALLEDAYAAEKPLESLERRHRFLALGHAPLKLRLQTLQQLADLDPGNATWRDDATIFERAREVEVRKELFEAARVDDLATITALDAELRAMRWIQPTELRIAAGRYRKEIARRQARAELEQIAVELNDAQSDKLAARAARARWEQNVAIAELPPDDFLWVEVQDVLDWLRREDVAEANAQALAERRAELTAALAGAPPLERLEQLADAAQLPADDPLQARVASKRAKLEARARRQTYVRITTIAGSALALVAAIVLGWWYYSEHQRIAGHVAALQKLIDAGNVSQAEQYIDHVKRTAPGTVESAALVPLVGQVTSLREAEKQRRANFTAALKRARDSLTDAPDDEAFAAAEKLARTQAEESDIATLRGEFAKRRMQRQTERDQQFVEKLGEYERRFAALAADRSSEAVAQRQALQRLTADLRAFRAENTEVTSAVAVRARELMELAQQHEKGLGRREEEAGHRQRLLAAVGNFDAFARELESHAAAATDAAQKADYQQVAAGKAAWAGLAKWNAVAARFSADRAQWNAARTDELLQEIATATRDCSGFPHLKAITDCKPHLEALKVRATTGSGAAGASLKQLLDDRFIKSLWMLEQGGVRYYMPGEPKLGSTMQGIPYLVNFEAQEKRVVPKADRTYLGPAPHAVLAGELLKSLEQARPDNWEKTFCDMIHRCLRAEPREGVPEVDPILRLQIVAAVVRAGCQGSYAMTLAFGAWREKLEAGKVAVSLNWLDPGDREVQAGRQQAREELATLPPLTAAIQKAADERRKFLDAKVPQYTWIGFLEESGGWRCATRPGGLPAAGALYVLAGSSTAAPQRIGSVRGGRARIETNDTTLLTRGRPVLCAAE